MKLDQRMNELARFSRQLRNSGKLGEAREQVEEQVVARQGEKNSILTITVAAGDDAVGPAGSTVGPPIEERNGPPIAAFVVGGLGVDGVQNQWTIAGVSAGIGGALLITGVVLFIVHGKSSSPRTGAASLSGQVIRF